MNCVATAWIVTSLLYSVKSDAKISRSYERSETEKYIMDIYTVCLKSMFKISKNWNEHRPYHPYTSSSVLHVDDRLYFIISFTEFMGLVFTLITTLLSGEEFVHSFCVYSGVGGFSGTKTIRGHVIRLTGNYSNSSITLDDLNRNAPVHLALFH